MNAVVGRLDPPAEEDESRKGTHQVQPELRDGDDERRLALPAPALPAEVGHRKQLVTNLLEQAVERLEPGRRCFSKTVFT